MSKIMRHSPTPQAQRGVVLLITLIVLAIISLLAITSVRNASSSENVSGNVRITELATQASELALRHCERSLLSVLTAQTPGSSSNYQTTFVAANILNQKDPAHWRNLDIWDSKAGTSAEVFVIPLDLLNQASMTKVTYQRPPECMVERMNTVLPGLSVPSNNSAFLVTSRGFGPEVPADANRGRPVGSEIWLQSQIILNY